MRPHQATMLNQFANHLGAWPSPAKDCLRAEKAVSPISRRPFSSVKPGELYCAWLGVVAQSFQRTELPIL